MSDIGFPLTMAAAETGPGSEPIPAEGAAKATVYRRWL
jgi:hypothetical protein